MTSSISDYNIKSVKKQKIFFIIGFLREIFHTTFFVYFALILLPRDTVWIEQIIAFILIFSAGYLVIPAGYLFLLYDDNKFRAIIQLLRISKILRILILFLLIVREFLSHDFFSLFLNGLNMNSLIIYIMLIILFFDLIFLYFLLSYKIDTDNAGDVALTSVNIENEVQKELNKGVNHDNPADSQR